MASVKDVLSGKINIVYPECDSCGNEIRDVHTDFIIELNGAPLLCGDCYSITLDNEIKRHPIGHPRSRRGGG